MRRPFDPGAPNQARLDGELPAYRRRAKAKAKAGRMIPAVIARAPPDEDIDAYRVTPRALRYMLALPVTAARKYLDHHPEVNAALDACRDDALVNGLVAAVYRHHQNAYASAPHLGVSAYDVAAATITNASFLASEHGVCMQQVATIHLEGIERALEHEAKGYGA